MLEDNLLESILETDGECVVSVDIYKNWMTGKPVFVDGNARVLSVGQEPQMAFDSSVKFVSDGWDLQIWYEFYKKIFCSGIGNHNWCCKEIV